MGERKHAKPIKTYEIIEDGKAIKCLNCGLTSWHPKDVQHRYCGNCHEFHMQWPGNLLWAT